ncbi:hypothetical protein KSP39_PZI009050 [Platanthera zijinensis]|uniref:Uncharacterized protein n=1 Tax=Platanthera zijinensis TaxID=2320716 RepID=A0AAP0G7Y4_9ASPA
MLLINWGCHRDLLRFLKLSSEIRVFVIDSHRPIHLHNISKQNDQIVVLYTNEDEHQADLIYDFDVSALANASDLNSDDEIGEEGDSDDDSESEVDEERGSRRRLSHASASDPIKLYGKLKAEYYKLGTFHGKPSGCLMFDLAHY